MTILPGFIPPLFETESNPVRFERVCIDLYKAAEGVTLVPTSYNYDQGRDGRSIGLNRTGVAILGATLSVGLDKKVRDDLARLVKTTKPGGLVYCTARKITEREVDEIEGLIRAEFSDIESVVVLSQTQLVALAADHETLLEKHFPGELNNLRQTLIAPEVGDSALYGLRLALATTVGDSADELRARILDRVILDVLSAGPQSEATLGKWLADKLHLPAPPSPAFLAQAVSRLVRVHAISLIQGRLALTAHGEELRTVSEGSAEKLLEGRSIVRDAFAELIGLKMPDTMFNPIWAIFQSAMAQAFHEHGLSIVEAVQSISDGQPGEGEKNFRALLDGVASRVASFSKSPEQQDEIKQAIFDMFSEQNRPAFAWLSEVCSVYVMMCSLGLEAKSARQLGAVLKSLSLVPDSDVVLSLLCEREHNHAAVERVIRGWQSLAGSALVATPVLEEVARHAWIADSDYQSTKNIFHKMEAVDAERVITNAFVRTYWHLSGGKARDMQWAGYIREFVGRNDGDFSRIALILLDEYGIERLPDFINPTGPVEPNSFEAELAEFIRNHIAEQLGLKAAHELGKQTLDKTRRDAKMMANLREVRDAATMESGRSVLILSSSRALREAAVRFRGELGEPDAVIALPAIATLLALTPGVQLGLNALKAVLFDGGLHQRLSHLQRLAYRVVTDSAVYSMPYSRRVTLKRRLREHVLADAKAKGQSVDELERELLTEKNEAFVVETVGSVLDRMAIAPSTAALVDERDREIESLRGEIARLRAVQSAGPA